MAMIFVNYRREDAKAAHESFGRDTATIIKAIKAGRRTRQKRAAVRWSPIVGAATLAVAGILLRTIPARPAKLDPAWANTPLTAAEIALLKPKDEFQECERCPRMVVVPAGSFMMGSTQAEIEDLVEQHHNGEYKKEEPQQLVTFKDAFAAGKYAVTFAEWDACVADAGCGRYKPDDRGWGREDRPVINVTWDHAKSYVMWLSKKTGQPYRLLSEAEREYVTRAGTSTPFWWGPSITTEQANYDGYYTYVGGEWRHTVGEYRRRTVPVNSFQPNPWGFYQVHGNVREWVEDCLRFDYKGAPGDGSAWTADKCGWHVLRGGSWDEHSQFLRAAYRAGNYYETNPYDNTGFRVARTLSP